MKAAVFRGEQDIRVEDVPKPTIQESTDAIVRVTHTAVCGSDLWFYRGQREYESGWRTGHEPMGIVTTVGDDVTGVQPGDRVFAPFAISCGKCEFCRKGLHTSCIDGDTWAGERDGAQAEKIRVPHANGTLVRIPDRYADNESVLRSVLPLSDVMGTGHHAVVSANVAPGSTAVIVGDGAVGLCAVLAARRIGAERIIILGHHQDRLEIAESFGATETISARGDAAVEQAKKLTYGGANHVVECVGTESSMKTAFEVARPGGNVGYVGVPAGVTKGEFLGTGFGKNITLAGGIAPVRAYAEPLLEDVLDGTLDPSPIFDKTVSLDNIADGYRAMHERTAIKVLVKP
ncbi:zinc-dependent alcohol dehydrogenase family protein [Salinarchaeum sp. IM2453]|uniref:zinc-dependent alcohol dehydrogenase family protein n=1 Tax=Salinarchaeum sp. IM2453 TaxID=2862870 RepID=UPI001C83F527|nr:zinc-dependent alcohol dehydrogenase family protein [Salinarchaeum sp. IM2453]QZA88319.1 zinc-dependent alcohol dehydrogenase family protein [Salinarchaeum sp. IM2453]